MFTNKELYTSVEYWMELIQNELYHALKSYMDENNLNQTDLAKELGFSKGYISQVLRGEFNHSLKKLIKLSLSVNKLPDIKFKDLGDYIKKLDDEYGKIIYLKNYKKQISPEKFVHETTSLKYS